MLVLSRKYKQKIIINGNIEIVVLKTKGKQLKIGINAPKDVTVYREEVYPGASNNDPTILVPSSIRSKLTVENTKASANSNSFADACMAEIKNEINNI